MKVRLLVGFLLAQLLACGFVFRDALWSASLLAPLDIAPALFSKYRELDPSSDGVPANHHIIDQLTYDLPLQHVIYEAYRRGETPWWDPYTFGGRPLLADAHISGTDPIRRICYAVLPFASAYNWTRIAHFILSGLGMLLLLRRLECEATAALLLSLAYEFGGGFAVFFGHPWIHASFVYYPFLWLAWEHGLEGKRWAVGVASLLVAGVLAAGNLQSHSYLVVFAGAFAFGFAGMNRRAWGKSLLVLGGSGVLGALLAAPILLPELELFAHNVRSVGLPSSNAGYLAGFASAITAYPWGFGTFRTLDLSKFFGRDFHLGFSPFIGCAALFLAVVGGAARPLLARAAPRRIALWLCGLYWLIISTPLNGYLYMRCAPLALMGVAVLAALGWQQLIESGEVRRRLAYAAWVLALGAAIGTNAFAWIIYPRLLPKVRAYVEQRAANNPNLDEAKALREFQVQRLPAEISFRNPEALLGFLGLAGVGLWLLLPGSRRHQWAGVGLLVLNLLPVLLFTERAVPKQSVSLWAKLQTGGAEQQRVAAVLAGKPLRLVEMAPGRHDQLFPQGLAALYRIRTLHGYAALVPRALATLPPAEFAPWRSQGGDWTYESKARGEAAGDFHSNAVSGLVRFAWASSQPREFRVSEPGLTTIELVFEPGTAGILRWTDTYYPGWNATIDSKPASIRPVGPCFSEIEIPASARRLVLQYQPSGSSLSRALAAAGLMAVVLLLLADPILRRARPRAAKAH